jgi:uncharacterized protein YndB with AHSA1/START domain
MIDTGSKLKVTTPSDREIVLTREFDAPRELVFKAMTDPEAIPKWWGPRRFVTIVDQMDLRPGGAWRFINRDADGTEYGFHGVYREILAPSRLVYTFEFEGFPGHASLETITLEEHDGKTTSVDTIVFDSKEDRDGTLQSGMATGAAESMDRLAELVAAKANQGVHG